MFEQEGHVDNTRSLNLLTWTDIDHHPFLLGRKAGLSEISHRSTGGTAEKQQRMSFNNVVSKSSK